MRAAVRPGIFLLITSAISRPRIIEPSTAPAVKMAVTRQTSRPEGEVKKSM